MADKDIDLKEALLKRGYFPENLPPVFQSIELGNFLFLKNEVVNQKGKSWTRAANYNASKRGLNRRNFSLIHPSVANNLAHFFHFYENDINKFFESSNFSLSIPKKNVTGRAVSISSHSDLEAKRLEKLSGYRFIARTDISRFYHSIYTHSLSWALHGKSAAKDNKKSSSPKFWGNKLDQILQKGQDGQTIGIPVGPDSSRYVAEIIGTAIDLKFKERHTSADCSVIRHVDDVWIGANTHADAEKALWRYREAIRFFELDINESKTHIHSSDFRFTDGWPNEIALAIEFACNGYSSRQKADRLRSAMEKAFSLAVHENDDGVLRFLLRYIDKNEIVSEYWNVVESFLKRVAVHFGHTIDYVVRILVWRHIKFGELDKDDWVNIVNKLLDHHGRLGNDSEVCWLLYLAIRLNLVIYPEPMSLVVENCGALSIILLLSRAKHQSNSQIFQISFNLLRDEKGFGEYWPLLTEWTAQGWPSAKQLHAKNDIIEEIMKKNLSILKIDALPPVFDSDHSADFAGVMRAIEDQDGYNKDESVDSGDENDELNL